MLEIPYDTRRQEGYTMPCDPDERPCRLGIATALIDHVLSSVPRAPLAPGLAGECGDRDVRLTAATVEALEAFVANEDRLHAEAVARRAQLDAQLVELADSVPVRL